MLTRERVIYVLLSVISAGVQLVQIPDFGLRLRRVQRGPIPAAAVGQELASTSAELTRRRINIAPTLGPATPST